MADKYDVPIAKQLLLTHLWELPTRPIVTTALLVYATATRLENAALARYAVRFFDRGDISLESPRLWRLGSVKAVGIKGWFYLIKAVEGTSPLKDVLVDWSSVADQLDFPRR